ncbi:M28 family peptidase [Chryseolinea sp. T2]|uniref:M28 family peptidase n=1 Tax=Chryseolinea sp. T2 TaxID=3129255 RepID=UPI0030775F1A
MKLRVLVIVMFAMFSLPVAVHAQTSDADDVKLIFDEALRNGKSYEWLRYLTTQIGPRLSGSAGAAEAVNWAKTEMQNIADTVWLQPVMVPHWIRGSEEDAYIKGSNKKRNVAVNVCALGGSVGTGSGGITAKVIEVKSIEELSQLGSHRIKGNIVFFNRPMDVTQPRTFDAYMGAVDQRAMGPSAAARHGAVGVIVRSMGLNAEDYPHTGALRYEPDAPKIPAIAISTRHADLLSQSLKEDNGLQFYFETHCEMLSDVQSYNVIAELKGSEYPEQIIVVGGHLDSWDLGDGAHDDGAGCVQSMEVLRIYRGLGLSPKHTVRVVLFMNEENGLNGGREYALQAEQRKEQHIAAIEADEGGFTPRGFSMTASPEFRNKVIGWKPALEPYGLTDFSREGGGADIGPLSKFNIPLIGYMPDSQRYFDYHHTKEDTFDKISKRELDMGAGCMAALIGLIDKHGVN